MTKDEALTLALEALENFKEVVVAAQVLGIKVGATGKNMRLGESFLHDEAITAIKKALAQPQEARNFCPRCGKRTPDPAAIHTCTPPRGLEMT